MHSRIDHARMGQPSASAIGAGGLLVAAWPVVAVLAMDPASLLPFGPARWAAVTAVVLLACVVMPPVPALGTSPLTRVQLWSWVALLAALGLGAWTGLDGVHAWIGTPDRRLGWLAWMGLAACWAVGTRLPDAVRVVGRGAVVAGVAVTAALVAEWLGWLPADGIDGRAGGTFGQPAILGAMAVLLLPVAAGVAAADGERRRWRCAGAVAAGGTAVAMLASGTRGAWLGLVVGAVPLLRVPLLRSPRRWRRRQLLSALAVLGVAVALMAWTPVGTRVAGMSGSDGPVAGRLAEWRVASRVVADHPALGVGPEGYRIAFPGQVDEGYAHRWGRELVTDRAHSGLLDVAVAGGLGAAAAYAVLLGAVVWTAWPLARRRGDPVRRGVAVAVIGYAVQQQVLFPLAEVDPVWWLWCGLLTAGAVPVRPVRRSVEASVRAVAGMLLGAVLVAGLAGVVGYRRMATAATLAAEGRTGQAGKVADAALGLRPDDIRLRFAAARIHATAGRITDVDAALAHVHAAQAISPDDPALRVEEVRLLVDRARRSGLAADLARARSAAEVAVQADPTNPATRLHLEAVRRLATGGTR